MTNALISVERTWNSKSNLMISGNKKLNFYVGTSREIFFIWSWKIQDFLSYKRFNVSSTKTMTCESDHSTYVAPYLVIYEKFWNTVDIHIKNTICTYYWNIQSDTGNNLTMSLWCRSITNAYFIHLSINHKPWSIIYLILKRLYLKWVV